MPPSTISVACPLTAAAISGSTSAVPGTSESARPPWFDTMMPSAPASSACRAPLAVMIPFTIKGFFVCARSALRSATVFVPG